jgi:hypothetical protein
MCHALVVWRVAISIYGVSTIQIGMDDVGQLHIEIDE